MEDSLIARGKVGDPAAVGQAIKQLLARTETTESKALVAINDVAATFRTLYLPAGTTDAQVDRAAATELSLESGRIVRQWFSVAETAEQRIVYAVAWDRDAVKDVTDAVRHAGLEPAVVDLKSLCLTRTSPEPSCVILDLVANPAEIVLIDQHLPQVWHSFELPAEMKDDVAPAVTGPLGSILRFHSRTRGRDAGGSYPVLVSAEQTIAPQVLAQISDVIEQPVRLLPPPARVPGHIRHSTYLTCIGLMMRRTR